MKHTLTLFTALLTPLALCAMEPTSLKTEFLKNPLGIDTAKPRFSWIVEDATPGAKQTAYQLQAASSPEKLAQGEADLWDSGKVSSDQSHLIEYAGQPLVSRQQVWWRVKTWDKSGKEGGWSKPASLELGLLSPSDWQAQWITAPRFAPVDDSATQLWNRRVLVPAKANLAIKGIQAEDAVFEEIERSSQKTLDGLRPAPYLRKSFSLPAVPKSARLYISGLGFHEVTINGKRIDDTFFSPAESHYPEYANYQVCDVTAFLREGENVVGVLLGEGRYTEFLAYGPRQAYSEDLPLIAQLEVKTDRGDVTVVSDETWRCQASPLLKNHFWLSECYDARRELPGWDAPGFNDSSWPVALKTNPPTKKLVPQTLPPERITRRVRPVALTQPRPGVWVFDMGEAITGCAELKIKAPSGTQVSLRYGEQIFREVKKYVPLLHGSLLRYDDFEMKGPEPGMLSCKMRGNGLEIHSSIQDKKVAYHAVPADVYVAKGAPQGERWNARFAYHPFRYVELMGYPGTPTLDTVTGLVIHTDLAATGSFKSSDSMLNQLHEAAVNSANYCTHGSVNDNPGAEKQSGLTPAFHQAKGSVFFRSEQPLWTKVLNDMRAITPEGMTPVMLGSSTRPDGLVNTPSPIWQRQGVEFPWAIRLYYGDAVTMAEYYPYMTAYVDHFTRPFVLEGKPPGDALSKISLNRLKVFKYALGGNLPGDMLGDHMDFYTAYGQPAPITFPSGEPNTSINEVRYLTPKELAGTAYVIGMTREVSKAARILGKEEDAKKYADLADRLTQKFNEVYYRPDLQAYGYPAPQTNYAVQGGTALALYFDLVPENIRPAVLASLVKAVEQWGGISTGLAATGPLLEVLAKNGHADLALSIFTQRKYPGPGQSLTFGSKTLPEVWAAPDGPAYPSLVQSEYVQLIRFQYLILGGIQPDPAAPGFKHFFLEPIIPEKLNDAECWTTSPYGIISSAWKREGDTIRWNVTIPWNSSATVKLPSYGGITVNGKSEDKSEFNLPAGKWKIVAKQNNREQK